MKPKVEELMIDRMDQNQEIVNRYLNDPAFQGAARFDVVTWVNSHVLVQREYVPTPYDQRALHSASMLLKCPGGVRARQPWREAGIEGR